MAKKETPKEKNYLESVSDKVGEIAVHYGFTVIKPPHVTQDDISKAKHFKDFDYYNDADEKVALTRWYIDSKKDAEPQPFSIHFKKPLHGSSLRKKPSIEMYGLEIMGSLRGTSEALLLKCTLSILEDLGYKDLYVDINSIGDKESISKFERELHSHFRKHAHTLPNKTKRDIKKNHYSILVDDSPETKEFRINLPQPVSSLSEVSRTHFKEVLESIEAFNVAYKIKPGLLSNKHYSAYTIFEVRQMNKNTKDKTTVSMEENGELLAYGYRYNYLAKKMGAKREIPTVGVTIFVKKNTGATKKVIIKKIKKPHFYLVQLGGTAKLKALNVVEMLRKNKIYVYHSITKDKITGQLNGAEYMKASHVLIMGQKEAIENSIVVRNIQNREQETVALDNLVDFLKNLGKGKKSR